MNPKIYKPEERVSQEVIDKLREDEEYFEQILPNGAEGVIGDVAIITHPDYEYGYSYLMDRSGNKPLLDFGDFKYDQKRHKEIFLNGKTHPDGKIVSMGLISKDSLSMVNPPIKSYIMDIGMTAEVDMPLMMI